VLYLATQQQADGSWRSFKSRSPDFTKAMEQPRVFPTIVVLLSLRQTSSATSGMVARGLAYLRSQMRDDFLWAVDGRNHELSFRWDHLPCLMPPDTDDTALAWILLGSELGADALQRVHAVFERHVGPDGLYPTYLTGAAGKGACEPDYENRPSLGVNVDVLAFFEHYGFDTARLRWGLEDALAVHEYWKDASTIATRRCSRSSPRRPWPTGRRRRRRCSTASSPTTSGRRPVSTRRRRRWRRRATSRPRALAAGSGATTATGYGSRGRAGANAARGWELARGADLRGVAGVLRIPAETTAIAVLALDSWLRTTPGAAGAGQLH
jgi:hypothetical protein